MEYCKVKATALPRPPLLALAQSLAWFGVPFVIMWRLPNYPKVSNSMTSTLLAGVDPDSSPDALSGAEERPPIPGMEMGLRGCLEVWDDPVHPPCDR